MPWYRLERQSKATYEFIAEMVSERLPCFNLPSHLATARFTELAKDRNFWSNYSGIKALETPATIVMIANSKALCALSNEGRIEYSE